ncbi:hypothetical protein K461DRAFT_219984 [Myriangium duriaei CBS 260.36]|uniref:Uncharacterized protein n=1 Tax=Myriangium duriaei CBS 260.36 TaxID=1168546 RepID=A0A9P4MLK2_9PEZI|nr:hypothetical protein K461DRAFT_219984 [Myriangium duriaei CBS 260.36]
MAPLAVFPGAGVGFLRLGAGLYDILSALKVDSKRFPKIDVSYSTRKPLSWPIIIELPKNGLRLRFDGPEQRLRLIEIMDLDQDQFTVKNEPLIQTNDQSHRPGQNILLYRRVYQLFGASYPGEYIPSKTSSTGTYVVSYPGIALSFALESSAWSPQVDHAKMLAERGTAVSTIALFEGKSWAEARKDLFTRKPSQPRSLTQNSRPKEGLPDEVEVIEIKSQGRIEFSRRTSFPVALTIGSTTAQDLITDFGPPDSIYKRPSDTSDTALRPTRTSRRRSSSVIPRSFGSTPSSMSSTNTDTYDADFEEDDGIDGPDVVRPEEQYYCYFHHGFDVLVGPATAEQTKGPAAAPGAQPVATRIILHGNVPGSFEFNRHRRTRWVLDEVGPGGESITSESHFPDVHDRLIAQFKDLWPEKEMREGMVIVRDWAGDSPSSSAILIGEGPDEEEEEAWGQEGSEKWLKNTQLYKFPGLMFEVMHNGAIAALTVY